MKNIISIFIIICLFSSCKGQNSSDNQENDWVTGKLLGKIKKIKEITYDGDDRSKTINGTLETNYNENGYITKIYSHGSYENTDPTTSKVYDRNNKLIEIKFYDSDNNEIEKITYTHSKEGKEIDKKIENKGMNIYYSEKVILKYNNANQLVGGQTINDGKVRSTFNTQHNADQKITEEKRFDPAGNLDLKIIKKFDKKGYLFEKLQYTGPETKDLEFTVLFKYNEKNSLVEIVKYNNDGSIEYKDSMEYLYDKTGNWIKKTEFRNNEISTITERKIEYF